MDKFSMPETKSRQTLQHRQFLMVHLLTFPELFHLARANITSDQFSDADDSCLRVLWKVAVNLFDEKGDEAIFENKDRAWSILRAECESYLQSHQSALPAPAWPELLDNDHGLLAWIYGGGVKDGEPTLKWGRDLLRDFLMERWYQDTLSNNLRDANERVILNMPQLLQQAEDVRMKIDAILTDRAAQTIGDDWQPQVLEKMKTGVDFIDKMIGGQVAGETYGVLGAFKAGKTTLAIQIFYGTSQVEEANKKGLDKNGNVVARPVYLAHYEAGSNEMMSRTLVHAAQINRGVVEEWSLEPWNGHDFHPDGPDKGRENWRGLSRQGGKLRLYEQARWATELKKDPKLVKGEFERYREFLSKKCTLHFLDFSGTGDNPQLGTGGVQEIADCIRRDIRETGVTPATVVIDYAGLCVRRFVMHNKLREDAIYHYLGQFGHDVLRLIAAPFKTPVWIMHQLSGEANKRTSATKQHHADAQGTKSFAENLWFNFQLGVPQEDNRAMWFTNGVSRRTAKADSQIVWLDGALGTIREGDKIFDVDGRHRFVRIEDKKATVHTNGAISKITPEGGLANKHTNPNLVPGNYKGALS
jgi:hypothetical protein